MKALSSHNRKPPHFGSTPLFPTTVKYNVVSRRLVQQYSIEHYGTVHYSVRAWSTVDEPNSALMTGEAPQPSPDLSTNIVHYKSTFPFL